MQGARQALRVRAVAGRGRLSSVEELLGQLRDRLAVIESSLTILKRRHEGDDAAERHYQRIEAQLTWARLRLSQLSPEDSGEA